MKNDVSWGRISRDDDNPLSFATKLRQDNVLNDVKEAIADNRTAMAYQPVVTAHNPSTIAFYEGLIRIIDERGRIIPAGDFIEQVETTETGRLIDCIALSHGLKALIRQSSLRLAINMSARSIGYLRWSRILERALRQDPSIGNRLILEITEHSAIQVPELICGFMRDLQNHGVTFALDDFGSGYTSFRHLRDFYFDILKIDGTFVRGVAKSADNQIIVASMISLSQQFGMMSVAEHVENKEDADFLIAAGIDCLQGYYYGVPNIKPQWLDQTIRAS